MAKATTGCSASVPLLESDDTIEPIPSEEADASSEPARYEVVTYPADLTLEGLVNRFRRKTITVSGFQRKFVWNIKQSSRLIESFLLGLPVPAIFLYNDPSTNKLIVVDGQQRLLSIVYFFEGLFGPEEQGKRVVFRLIGLSETSPYLNKTYDDLEISDEPSFNHLNDSVLRAFIIKQINPNDKTSIFHIFERLNTGGVQLVGQEIRNCIYNGAFNDMLHDLNKNPTWRSIFGKTEQDKRFRDMELLLRFFALLDEQQRYEKPMKDFLSKYMAENREPRSTWLRRHRSLFLSTTQTVYNYLKDRPFHLRAGLNAAAFDAVFVSIARNLNKVPLDFAGRFRSLVEDDNFKRYITSGTTDEDAIKGRIELAERTLFGPK